MKSIIANYHQRVLCLRIVTKLGVVIRITHYIRDLMMSNGVVYATGASHEFTGYTAASNLSPAMVDLEGIASLSGISYDAVASGIFDGARAYLFATTWNNPIEDEEPIVASILGKTTFNDKRYTKKRMALVDTLSQSTGNTFTVSCGNTYGDAWCGIALATVTVTGTVSSVASRSIVSDSSRSEVADWFGAGTIQLTSGLNAGLKPLEIKSFVAGVFETFDAFHYLPVIGDSYVAIKGCRKRESDCKAQTPSNIINFFGFSFIPTGSTYAKVGGQ